MNTIFKKNLLAVLVAAAFVLSAASVSAQALNIDLWDTATQTITYASEINTSGGMTLLTGGVEIDAKFGFGANQNEERYVRFDLSDGAKFLGTLNFSSTVTATGATGPNTGTISTGGNGQSYVIFNFNSPNAATAIDETCRLTVPGGVNISKSSTITVSYKQYKFPFDALNQTNPIANSSGTLIKFAPALDVRFKTVTPEKIDVTQESKVFNDVGTDTSNKTTAIADISIGIVPAPVPLWTNGLATTLANIIANGTKLIVNGDFSSTQNLTGGVPNGTYTASNAVYFDTNDGKCDSKDIKVAAMTAGSATFNLYDTTATAPIAITGSLAGGGPARLCMETNGVSVMNKTVFTGLYDITNATGSNAADIPLGVVTNPLSELKKNGSVAQKTFVLNAADAYSSYIRVTNPSGINGAVFVTLINDSGKSATFNLKDVVTASEAIADGKLKAGASTPLIPIGDIYKAAQVADTAFAVSGTSKKLRMNVEAEFGTDTVGDLTGVVVNIFGLARDGNSIFMTP